MLLRLPQSVPIYAILISALHLLNNSAAGAVSFSWACCYRILISLTTKCKLIYFFFNWKTATRDFRITWLKTIIKYNLICQTKSSTNNYNILWLSRSNLIFEKIWPIRKYWNCKGIKISWLTYSIVSWHFP